MYDCKLYLTQKELLEHQFKINARGYDPEEVDHILDMAVQDYGVFIKNAKEQKSEIEKLMNENALLRKELRNTQDELDTLRESEEKNPLPNNIDLLRRISSLEKVVFGKDE